MKFTTQVFLWLGASLVLVSAFPVGHQPTDLMGRNDGDAYAAVAVRDFDPIEDELYERDFDEREFDEFAERDLENGLQERQVQAVIKVAEKVAEGIVKVVDLIKDKIQKDKNARSQWTQDFVNRLHTQNPHFNYVICHTDHTAKWDGVRGKDWSHMHQEFPVSFGKTVGYEIYWGRTGTFQRKGDGGYLNWAFYGNVKSRSSDGKTIVWGKP